MADNTVSEELCQSRRDTYNVRLSAIQSETSEIRAGVGKMLRIVMEGNGAPSLVSSVSLNTDFRATMEQWLVNERKERIRHAEQEKRDRKQHSLTMLLASCGWGVTIVLFIVGIILKG